MNLRVQMDIHFRRTWTDRIMRGLCWSSLGLALVPLMSLLYLVFSRGLHRLDMDFFVHLPRPVGIPGGGMANGLIGTLTLVFIACVVAVPVGVAAGIYLAEYGGSRYATLVRFWADVLTGVPSIVTGIFAYQILVKPMGGFSALAGGFALGTMMVPIIVRVTEEVIRQVPVS
ncbi:MAG: phosphate ABC transporter permease PstA, partial [bacterium]